MKTCMAVLLAVLASSATVVAAQDANAAGGAGSAANGGNTTRYDFDDDLVQGDMVRPDGEVLNVRRRSARQSLIRIREHFVPEMLKSVENL